MENNMLSRFKEKINKIKESFNKESKVPKVSLWHRFINFIRYLFHLNRKPAQNDELIKEATIEEVKLEGVVLELPASTSSANTSELRLPSGKIDTESAVIETREQTASIDAGARPENGSKQMSAPDVKEAASVHISIESVPTTVAASAFSTPGALLPNNLSLNEGIKTQAPELDSGEKKADSLAEKKLENDLSERHGALMELDEKEDSDDEFFDCEESVNESSSQASDVSGSLASSSDVSSSKAETCKQAMDAETRKMLDEMTRQASQLSEHLAKSRPKGPSKRPPTTKLFQAPKAETIEADNNKDAVPAFSSPL